jgi:hypothetical protein
MFNIFFFEIPAAYKIGRKYAVSRGRPQMTLRVRIACWICKAIDTHSEYIMLIHFPQQCLQCFLCPRTPAKTLESRTFMRTWDEGHCKCTIQRTVHFIIVINIGNMLLCVVYQTIFTYLYMLHEYQVIYSFRYYLQFHVYAVNLRVHYPSIRGHYFTSILKTNQCIFQNILFHVQ